LLTMALKVGFIGGGMMAEALVGGLLKAGACTTDGIIISEPIADRRKYMQETFKVKVTDSNTEVCAASDVVVIAVKPQVLDAMLEALAKSGVAQEKFLLLSIVAGKTISFFARFLPNTRVARVMPNTPSLVGCGASAYVLSESCTNDDAAKVDTVMGACGITERVANEGLMDAITGLSGSGPAYVYLMIEAMSDGGVRMGLPRATATRLAAQTVMGAGQMALEAGKHTGELKDAVTSPGGTTIAGVHALESGGFRGTVMNAVQAAANKSTELGR